MAQLAGRDVDRDGQLVVCCPYGVPGRELAAGLVEHPLADRDDQVGVLGDADERVRCEQAAGRVLPTDQRLEAEQLTGVGQRHQRLVDEDELVVLQPRAQLALHRHPGDRAFAYAGVEELEAAGAPTSVLRLVHRGVGVAQEDRGRGQRVVGDGDADAAGDVDDLVLVVERLGKRTTDPAGDDRSVLTGADPVAEDDELIAAEPGDRVRTPGRPLQPRGDLEQQRVTGRVPEAVVDDLEPVEVEEEHGEPAGLAFEPDQRLLQPVDEQYPVGQPGQRVLHRLESERLLGPLAVGQVAHDGEDPGDPAVVVELGHHAGLQEQEVRLRGVKLDLGADPFGEHVTQRRLDRVEHRLRDVQLAVGAALGLVGGEPQQGERRRVVIDVPKLGVVADHRVGARLEQPAQVGLGAFELLALRLELVAEPLAVGDVEAQPESPDDGAVVVAQRHLGGDHPGVVAVGPGLALLEVDHRLARTDDVLLVVERRLGVLVGEEVEVAPAEDGLG